MTLPPLILLTPLILLATAAFSLARPGCRPGALPRLAEGAALAALAFGIAGLVQLVIAGPVAFSGLARLDAVSATMVILVSFVGWVVVRYARSYLDGEAREGAFHGLLLAALAAVNLQVQAANLAVLAVGFIATGLVIKQLLMFYPDRAEARARRRNSPSSGARATPR